MSTSVTFRVERLVHDFARIAFAIVDERDRHALDDVTSSGIDLPKRSAGHTNSRATPLHRRAPKDPFMTHNNRAFGRIR